MKRSYSLFVAIGLFAALMFIQNPGFARSDQDIGFAMEIVTPSVGDIQAIPTPCTVTEAVNVQKTELSAGTIVAGQESKSTLVDAVEQFTLRRQGRHVVYNFPPIDILPLSLPPPPVTLRE